MIFLGIFIVELLVLFLSSQALIRAIGRLVYVLTKSQKVAIHVIAFLFLPGTIIHELAHIISAGVMMVHTGAIEFIPEIHEDGVKLGTAEIGKTDPFRRSLIGVAPVLVGIAIILGSLFYLSASLMDGKNFSFWIYLTLFYIIFVIGNTMFSSKKDLEGSALVLVLLISLLIGLYLLNIRQPFVMFYEFIEKSSEYIKRADIFLILPLLINFLLIGFTKFFFKGHH